MLITEERPLDAPGRPRSPAALPGYHSGRPPRNMGLRYPADPPRVEEIVAVMREAGNGIHGSRIRGLIVVLWRADLRISEALDLTEGDLDSERDELLRTSSAPVNGAETPVHAGNYPGSRRWRLTGALRARMRRRR
jgi:hypothetical protein